MNITKHEASEIYYALITKRDLIAKGQYGNLEEDFTKRWIRDLERLIKKIGPDGEKFYLTGGR